MGALIADGRGLVPLVGSLCSLEVGVLGDKRVINTGGVRSSGTVNKSIRLVFGEV